MMYIRKSAALLLTLAIVCVVGQLNCPTLTPRTPAATIWDLHPADVKVVMAMGDSFLSAYAMSGTMEDSRGQSFAMGGDPGAVTLPNFLQFYNPNVTGFSVGLNPTEVCYGPDCTDPSYTSDDGLNAAKSGSLLVDIGGFQINHLIRAVNMRNDMDVNTDWKVLTIMAGIDDFCAACAFNGTLMSADDYKSNLMGTLERVRSTLPRTFVNLVAAPNISQTYELSLRSDCWNAQRTLFVSCGCIFDPANGALRESVDALMTQYNAAAAQVAAYYQAMSYDNFGVVVQPFLSQTHISDLPSSDFSRLDCFHPAQPGQQAMAIALWNAMLTPAAQKQQALTLDAPICPTDFTLLYTY